MSNDSISLKITKIGGNEYVIIAAFAARGLCADVPDIRCKEKKFF